MYINGEARQTVGAAIALGICILLGLATAGYFIGDSIARLKPDLRTISVKGIAEKEFKADRAVWTLGLRNVSHDFKSILTKITADREATVAFLRRKAFKDEEIERQPTLIKIERQPALTINKEGRENGQLQAMEGIRYTATTSIVVKTSQVDQVQKAFGAVEELLKTGVLLDGERESQIANPRYFISSLNMIRPQLLTEATKNALATAQQLASDSGVKLGRIRSVNQGMTIMLGLDGNDESNSNSASSSSMMKRLRVDSTFEFDIQ